MDLNSPTDPPDLRYILPRDAYHHLMRSLHTSLPPPPSDTPEHVAQRDNEAMSQVAALLPVNAAEAALAAQHVATHAQSMECMRLIREQPAITFDQAAKLRAQSASMSRQSQGAIRILLRVQAVRHAIEANPTALNKAAWTEHCAIGLMAQALPGAPAVAPPEPFEPPPPEPAPEPPQDAEPQPDPLTEADQYAVFYPDRAALIRQAGRVPDTVRFGPPEDHIVRALVTGRTPTLLALDAPPQPQLAAAD